MLFCLTRRHYKTCSLNPNIWSLFMPRIDVVFAAVGCILPSFDITRRSNVSTLVCCSVGSSWSKERTTTGIATEEKDDSDGDVIPGIHETWWSSISLNFSFPCNGPSPFRRMWRGGKKRWIPTQNIWNMSTFGALLSALWCHKLTNVSLFHPFLIIIEFITTRRSNNEK